MKTTIQISLLLAATLTAVSALTPDEWRSQSIYQVLTDRFARTDGSTTASCFPNDNAYCGGSWAGITQHLDYIQGLGATAVWISPFVQQLQAVTAGGESYHGFWPQDIFAVNPKFGTDKDLIALSDALHARGMYLMTDIVTNHMAYPGCRECVNYTSFNPFNQKSQYHTPCTIDFTNIQSTQICWEGDDSVALADLRTEDDAIRKTWNDWIAQMVVKYKIDGLRLDSALEVEPTFWPGFGQAAGVYQVGEVLNADPKFLSSYQPDIDGVLNYPLFFWITNAFASSSGSIQGLVDGIAAQQATGADVGLFGTFMENHDQKRFPSYTLDFALVRNALAFTMLFDGIPIIYQGQEQHFIGGAVPNNREALWLTGFNTSAPLYSWIAGLNALRARAIAQDKNYLSTNASVIFSDQHVIAVRKGAAGAQIVGVYANVGAGGNGYQVILPANATGFTAGQKLVEVTKCTAATVDGDGNLAAGNQGGEPVVYYPASQLTGSGLCTELTGAPTTTRAVPSQTGGTTSSGTSGTPTSVGGKNGAEVLSPSLAGLCLIATTLLFALF